MRLFKTFLLPLLLTLALVAPRPAAAYDPYGYGYGHRSHGGAVVAGVLAGALLGAATVGVLTAPRAYGYPVQGYGYAAPVYVPQPVYIAPPVYAPPVYANPGNGPEILPPVVVEALPALPRFVGPNGAVVGHTFDGHTVIAMPVQALPMLPIFAGRSVVPMVVYGPNTFAPLVLRTGVSSFQGFGGFQGYPRPY